MARKPKKGFKVYFSQGRKREYKEAHDDFNPFRNLSDDVEEFAERWKKGKANIFLFVGDFTIDIQNIINAYPQVKEALRGGKVRKRNMPVIVKLRDDLKKVEELLKDKEFLQNASRKAYINVVPAALDEYLTAKGARHIAAVGGATEQGKTVKSKFAKTFWQVSKAGEYSKMWERVVSIILDGLKGRTKYLKKRGTGVEGFNLKDLMSIEVERSKSKYRSVFMMEEFGTGQNVQGDKRVYLGKGRTLFKVPPYLIQAAQPEITKPELKLATAAWYVTRGALAYGEGQYALYMKTKNKKGKEGLADQALKNLARNLEHWTYGYGLGEFHKGRSPRNLFFQKGGIAAEIRDIQLKAQAELVKVINAEIEKKAPGFPGVIAVIRQR